MSADKQYYVTLNYQCMAQTAEDAVALALAVAGSPAGLTVEAFSDGSDQSIWEGDHGQLYEEAASETLKSLEAQFGPGLSHGVFAILAHDNLPLRFDAYHWSRWSFRPADAAFDKAQELNLIEPVPNFEQSWRFTPIGRAVARLFQAKVKAGA